MRRLWAISLALVACKTRAEPPAQVAPSAPAPPSVSAPLPAPSPPGTVSSPTDAGIDTGTGLASFVVKHHFGSDLDFVFTLGGKRVQGTFHAVTGRTTTFSIPSGKLVWRPAACQLSEESERAANIELGPGDVARIECEQSNREGMCCEQKSIERAPTKN